MKTQKVTSLLSQLRTVKVHSSKVTVVARVNGVQQHSSVLGFLYGAATWDTPSRGPRFQAGTFLWLISIKNMDAFFTCYLVSISSVHFRKGLHNFRDLFCYDYIKMVVIAMLTITVQW